MGNRPELVFEDDLMADNNDSALFETISDYYEGRMDLEEIKNDHAISDARIQLRR